MALFEHEFQSAPAWPVLDALAAFQNDDGGFGHGLEPDAVTPASGALATSVALRALVEIGAPATHPTVGAVAGYLERTFDAETQVWRIVPAATGEHPHAPWWLEDGLAERFNGFRLNPKAEIVAHLLTLRAPVDRAWLSDQVEVLVAEIEKARGTGLEMHDLIAAVRLLEAGGLPATSRSTLAACLTELAERSLSEATGAGYGLRALDLAPLPSSALADALADRVVAELDELIRSQAADGAWWPQWDWGAEPGSAAATAWQASALAWAGVITLQNLRILAAHGLIDRG